jgi:predicted DCC family thiol-disulfide oxidoreductase YuxK
MQAPDKAGRSVLYWDADCSFCRRWVERWRRESGEAVEYRTLQGAPADVTDAAGGPPFDRIVLVQPDGTFLTGAAAALAARAAGGQTGKLSWFLYRRVPQLRALAEAAYRWVARHRPLCGRLTSLFWGATPELPTYEISGFVFPRLIGLIFLSAFISLWVQIDGLAGSKGILPVAAQLEAVKNHFSASGAEWSAWLQFPTLLWFGASDAMLHFWIGVGALASVLLVLGFAPATSAFIAWACYLSFAAAVPVFLNFQWDALLLEAGLLVVLYVPWTRYLRFGHSAPSRLGRLLVWWLLFRLMFESGVVKLYGFDGAGRNVWLEGTALTFHYFTQPIPLWTSWWMSRLPDWFHALSLVFVFFIELVVPFFIAGPRRMRMTAFWAFTLLMLLIIASGHYGFFNLLTIALCVTLVDDASWPRWARQRLQNKTASSPRTATGLPDRIRNKVLPWLAALLVLLTTLQLLLVLRIVSPAAISPVLGPFMPFRSANSYGLFSVMTTERPEITVEASSDGLAWQPYRFRYAMSPGDASMPFLLPHMPRLDWQMWFAALEYRAGGQPPGWMMPFLARLQENAPPVLGLLARGGAADLAAPKYFRLRLDLLQFAPPNTHKESGRFWEATPLPTYTIEGSLQR